MKVYHLLCALLVVKAKPRNIFYLLSSQIQYQDIHIPLKATDLQLFFYCLTVYSTSVSIIYCIITDSLQHIHIVSKLIHTPKLIYASQHLANYNIV